MSSASSEDALPHEVGSEVLATLSALGVDDELQRKVHEAISQLEQASNNPSLLASAHAPKHAGGNASAASTPPKQPSAAQAAEAKLQMSRSIMRKLHHKNVALEKELQMYKANASPIAFSNSTPELLEKLNGAPQDPSSSGSKPTSILVAHALQERDETILQLRLALDASRRSNVLLGDQLSALPGAAGSGSGRGGAQPGGRQQQQQQQRPASQQVLDHGQMQAQRYKQIRSDYNKLLFKRSGFSQASKAAPPSTQAVLKELKSRLSKEMSERDAEAALYSTRLYESERHLSDWYVEKRVLEDHIAHLNSEIAERDRLDQQIQSCVCGLFERVAALEAENAALLQAKGPAAV